VPVPGDYDGDGVTDLAVWRGSTGQWYVLRSSDGAAEISAWGLSLAPYLDVPVPGDYDGDGRTDVAVFRRSSGTWLINQSRAGQYTVKAWGLASDVPVAADYDGDGQTDLAVWRQGTWYIWQSATASARVEDWGASAAPYFDQAAPGDYDGDGRADLAVWRMSTQTWYVRTSQTGTVLTPPQGRTSDVPVARQPRF
jgi:spore coat protein A